MRKYKTFNKDQRSTFSYWFWHWLAFNDVARQYGVWKFRHIFHDIEKPFLRIFLPYKKVQDIHRKNNKHHLEYKHPEKRNWTDIIIDWECSHLTKKACSRNALQEAAYKYSNKEMTFDEYCDFFNTWIKIYHRN